MPSSRLARTHRQPSGTIIKQLTILTRFVARLDVESLLVEISQNEIPPRSVVNAKQAYAIQPKIIENLSKAVPGIRTAMD